MSFQMYLLGGRVRSNSNKTMEAKEITRSSTDYWKQYTTNIPSEETNRIFDKGDRMERLLHEQTKKTRKSQRNNALCLKNAQSDAEELKEIQKRESEEMLKDIPQNIYSDWNQRVENDETLKKDLEKGTMDERRLRVAFDVSNEKEKECIWVDQYLMSKEPDNTLTMPVMTSWDEMKELFGKQDDIKDCAPVYWENEVRKGRGERARLIEVGVDIPAIWDIDDAAQIVTADLYLCFKWKVKAIRKEIWDNMSREFIKPVWKVRLRNGKFINNLKKFDIMDDDHSCGDEKDGLTTIIQRITITAEFSQSFHLQRFPFDRQQIEFVIRYWLMPYTTKHGEKRGRLLFYEDKAWECRVKEGALKPSDEWDMVRECGKHYDKLNFISSVTEEKMDPKLGRKWPEISFSFHIKRNPEFMKWNIALPITMVVVFGLFGNVTGFYSDFDRTSFTAALLFTIFSIKGNVQYALSKVGYRTTLDSYILLSQAMIIIEGCVGVLFSHTSEEQVRLEHDAEWYDFQIPIIFGLVGLVFWGIVTWRFWFGQKLWCFRIKNCLSCFA